MQGIELIFSYEFKNDKDQQTLCKTFVKKNNIDINEDFSEIIEKIEVFLKPILIKGSSAKILWVPDKGKWIK